MSELSGQLPGSIYTRIVDHALFRFLLELEVAKARRLRYCVSVVSLCPDVASATKPDWRTVAAARIIQHVRATDVVALVPEDSLTLIVVDADTRALRSIVNRIVDRAHGVCQEGETTWSAGAACYPITVTDAAKVMPQAVELMTLAQGDGGNRLYLSL